ncbi:MAG: cadherin-like domain-containing protein, partial [Pseudomonadota bacterium]
NTPPEAVDDAYAVAEDGSLSVAAGLGVLANDSDVDGDALTAVLGTDVTDGTLTLSADGSFDYAPDADFNGTDSFTYTVSDGQGGTSTPATVTITVNPVNDPPQAVADSYTTGRDTQLAVTLAASGLLANDIDIDGDALTASLAATQSTAVAGTAVVNADGTFTFDPTAGFTGTTGFDYVVSDPSGASATGRVTIGVTFDNTPPEAVDDAYAVAEDGSLSVAAGL